ncbi:Delta(12)-fatty-acid desaturase [Cymbomonas tetramitiformis]|uniref:Delta(12)-fatty-acid desaturase n=1 Tax=Cymbomonas tetramitiformis TaxID=36881 RepID=A0AAE0EYJ3_9CHLO|nr:Delta(12)-fatty-acid desaturase [Cymbomonas tetramitiformis]
MTASTVATATLDSVSYTQSPHRRKSSIAEASGGGQSDRAFPEDVMFSGLKGKALKLNSWPSKAEVMRCIPRRCFVKETSRSLGHAAVCVAMTLACGVAAYALLPVQLAATPLWILYGALTGTVATGCWVIAHECGHNAFSDNKVIQDLVGYVLHTALLVPYYSWQRSHAVHHSRTNHLTEGETHVPHVRSGPKALGEQSPHAVLEGAWNEGLLSIRTLFGESLYGAIRLVAHLFFGWPAYLLTGATGGPVRGVTNHFLPFLGNKGEYKLFPESWTARVYLSDLGIIVMLGALIFAADRVGVATVACVYGLPLAFTNVWLVLYTWLQHSDTDIPHFDGDDWDFMKGAFCTVDRPYGPVLDFLHHRIGSTHVAHHICSAIPHYHALEATNAIKASFPDHYLFDPTPIHKAMWRVGTKCVSVRPYGNEGMWVFRQ